VTPAAGGGRRLASTTSSGNRQLGRGVQNLTTRICRGRLAGTVNINTLTV
jgi:hypothetical protein